LEFEPNFKLHRSLGSQSQMIRMRTF